MNTKIIPIQRVSKTRTQYRVNLINGQEYLITKQHSMKLYRLNFMLMAIIVDKVINGELRKWRIPFNIRQDKVYLPIQVGIYTIPYNSGELPDNGYSTYSDDSNIITYEMGESQEDFLESARKLYYKSHFGYTAAEVNKLWKSQYLEIKLLIQKLNAEYQIYLEQPEWYTYGTLVDNTFIMRKSNVL